ncbi:MAG: glycosyltransferase family protein [Salinisphaeraceae bacterium]|nr:glycosyltransferase family protein [Salinisphaeraceae bacterium]
MRILYGVMGYGRGHATRVAAVLPELLKDHEIHVVGGIDAYEYLSKQFDNGEQIPTIGYAYGEDGRISVRNTMLRNAAPMTDLLLGKGPGSRRMDEIIGDWRPDVIISDSEGWTHRAARRWGIPRISFDHVGVMAYCRPPLPAPDWWLGHRDALGYRMLMGWPDRVLVSSFYPALPRGPEVEVIGPLLRDPVYAAKPKQGDYLMAYFNKGLHQYNDRIEAELSSLPFPVRVYGTGREGSRGSIEYFPPSVEGFINDLAGSRAVLTTSGHQLLSESIHFGKPVYTLPEDCFEQRLNAYMVQRMGIGVKDDFDTLSAGRIEEFLENSDVYAKRAKAVHTDGRTEALSSLKRYLGEFETAGAAAFTATRLSRS